MAALPRQFLVFLAQFPDVYSVRKGLMWFLIVTPAGLTSVASILSSLVPLLSQNFRSVGIPVFEPEPYVFLSDKFMMGIDFTQIPAPFNIVRTSRYELSWATIFLASHQNIDVPRTRANHIVDHYDTDVHISGSLWRED